MATGQMAIWRHARTATMAALLSFAAGAMPAVRAEQAQPANPLAARILIVHEEPTDPAHRPVMDRIRTDPTFIRSRDFFAIFRLPRDLTLRTRSCSGRGGAWYFEGMVTICYEYLKNVFDSAGDPQRPSWVSEEAAIAGPIADVVLHEGAHALFEFLRTPLLGREEDAADMISTFAILNLFGRQAPALIRGVAYSYLVDARARNFTDLPTLQDRVVPSRQYGGAHSTALQRLFNVVCHASGFDEAAYRDLVALSDLPPFRAGGCEEEYRQIAHAFQTLLAPHLDLEAARRLFPDARLTAPPRP